MVIDATLTTVDDILSEMTRQRELMESSANEKLLVQQAIQEQLLLDTNKRFDSIMSLIRELQKSVNQYDPATLKDRIRSIVSIDPLIPRADQFERHLKELEDSLRKNEVIIKVAPFCVYTFAYLEKIGKRVIVGRV